MAEILEALRQGFIEHWSKVVAGAVLMLIGWAIGWWRSRKKWQRKEFFERINFSLNSINDGTLQIRTVLEKSCQDVFLNQVAVKQLMVASQKTTSDNPLIPLAADEYWYFLNAALNEVSEKFADGFFRRDIGQPVKAHVYVMCLTNETDPEVRNRKVRAMLIREEDLKNLPEEMPELESPNHKTRWHTLLLMQQQLESVPHQFIKVELVL